MGVGETGVGETGVGEHVLIPGHCCFICWFIMYAAEGTKIGGHMTVCKHASSRGVCGHAPPENFS